MSFQAKVIGAVGAVMGAAVCFILFFRTSDEAEIEALLREGAEAAQRADADAVVALLSQSFSAPQGDYGWAEGRIRQALKQSPGQIEVRSCVVQVDGDKARALLKLRGHLGPNELWRISFDFHLRKEEGGWKITSLDERWDS
jgi:ketosteroid isomerase-like protein